MSATTRSAFVDALRSLERRSRFIDTLERDEAVTALRKVWALLPPSVDRHPLEEFAEALGD